MMQICPKGLNINIKSDSYNSDKWQLQHIRHPMASTLLLSLHTTNLTRISFLLKLSSHPLTQDQITMGTILNQISQLNTPTINILKQWKFQIKKMRDLDILHSTIQSLSLLLPNSRSTKEFHSSHSSNHIPILLTSTSNLSSNLCNISSNLHNSKCMPRKQKLKLLRK